MAGQVAENIGERLALDQFHGVVVAAVLLAGVAVPALAFGVLFWKRGFASALVADATALIALALLV